MNYKLDTITIHNFKSFAVERKITVNGSNLLVYGENGCGKSSIFWSLYTLLNAWHKDSPEAVKKYFNQSKENLRNRFVPDAETSFIEATFKDGSDKSECMRLSEADTALVGSTEVFQVATSCYSYFLNYQKQTSFFDFCNSDDNELFVPFYRDIMPYMDFGTLKDLDNNDRNKILYASEWWQYLLNSAHYELHKEDGSKIENYDEKLSIYKALLRQFNEKLEEQSKAIIEEANKILKVLLSGEDINDVELVLEYSDALYDNPILYHPEVYDESLRAPQIILLAKCKDINEVAKQEVRHLRTYFNEAKLSLIALSIRLAQMNINSARGNDGCRLLVVDDLLVSLDMANRIKVMNLLLKKADEGYQLFVFTHDRVFYKLMSQTIEENGQKANWTYCNMYMAKDDKSAYPDIETTFIYNEKDNLESARHYMNCGDYAAASICLRKECERVIKVLLEPRFTETEDVVLRKIQSLPLGTLITAIPKAFREYGLSYSIAKLNVLRESVLNVSAHDSIYTPIYRSEIEAAITELDNLKRYERTPLVSSEMITAEQVFLFHMVAADMKFIHMKFCYQQTASRLTDRATGQSYYQKDLMIKILDLTKSRAIKLPCVNIGDTAELSTIFNLCKDTLAIDPLFEETIRKKGAKKSKSLKEMKGV